MPPALVLGTAAFGLLDTDTDDPEDIVLAALNSNAFVGFDAHPGDAEMALGDVLRLPHVEQTHPRPSYYLAAKGGRTPFGYDWSTASVRHELHASLRRLRTAYVDTYWLHGLEFGTPEQWCAQLPSTLEYLATQRRQGVVRRIGLMVQPTAVVVELFRTVPSVGLLVDTVFCYGHTTVLRAIERAVLGNNMVSSGLCPLRYGDATTAPLPAHVDLVDGSPYAMGMLHGRRRPTHPLAQVPPVVAHMGREWSAYVHTWNANLRARDGRSVADIAVDYTVSRTVASSVVVGARTVRDVDGATRAWSGVEMREWEVL